MKLRPQQQKAMDDLADWLGRHRSEHPIINMCVGAGKSVIIAQICKDFIAEHPSCRIIMAVASRILVQQNVERLRAVWPEAPIGICSGDLGKDTRSQIIFGTIQTLANRTADLGRVDILLVDECHNINPKNVGRYREFIGDLQRYGSPALCVIGLTGTPFRGNGVWLTAEKDAIFEGIAATVSMDDLLEAGYLAPLVVDSETPEMTGDLSQVKVTNFDYATGDLDRVMSDGDLVHSTIADLLTRGANRKKWLVFCAGVNHATAVNDELNRVGIPSALITGNTNPAQRDKIMQDYRAGILRALVNVDVLTTGVDVPEIDLIALLRPTKSYVLYVQIAGRGMRIAEGKTDCLWLDYTPTTSEKGAVNKIKGRDAIRKQKGEAPFKLCPECGNRNPPKITECADCGFTFPVEEKQKHETKAGSAEIIAGIKPVVETWHDVRRVTYAEYRTDPAKPPTLCVTYHIGEDSFWHDQTVREWWAFESFGTGFVKAQNAWHRAWCADFGQPVVPQSIAHALELIENVGLKQPNRIATKPQPSNPKYLQVTNYVF